MNVFAAAALGLLGVTAAPYLCFLGLYAWIRPEGPPAAKEPAEPTVSVALPTYNEERVIQAKLDDLLKFGYPMEKVEFVIYSSTDGMRLISTGSIGATGRLCCRSTGNP